MLAPFGIRFIVVPLVDGLASTSAEPLAVPDGLIPALSGQLDLRRRTTPPSFVVFENTAAMPSAAAAAGDLAVATQVDSLDPLVGVDTSTATPVLVGADRTRSARGGVPVGTVHLGVAPDSNWRLALDGQTVPVRPAFGVTSAYDVSTAGEAMLDYRTGGGRRAALLVVGVAWVATVLAASRLGVPAVLRRSRTATRRCSTWIASQAPSTWPSWIGRRATAPDSRDGSTNRTRLMRDVDADSMRPGSGRPWLRSCRSTSVRPRRQRRAGGR